MANVHAFAEEISLIMPRISRKILADLFETSEIPHAQLYVLGLLYHNGPCRIADIGREMHIAPPTVTGIIDRLEKTGLIRRIEKKEDRRVVIVELTAEGKKVSARLKQSVVKRWAEVLEKIPPEDAAKYVEILRKIKDAI